MADITLEFLAEKVDQVLQEQTNQRADTAVMLAMLQRFDGTLAGLTAEVRALHGQIGRLRYRIEQLENKFGVAS